MMTLQEKVALREQGWSSATIRNAPSEGLEMKKWNVWEKVELFPMPTRNYRHTYKATLIWLDKDGNEQRTFAFAETRKKALKRVYSYRRNIQLYGGCIRNQYWRKPRRLVA